MGRKPKNKRTASDAFEDPLFQQHQSLGSDTTSGGLFHGSSVPSSDTFVPFSTPAHQTFLSSNSTSTQNQTQTQTSNPQGITTHASGISSTNAIAGPSSSSPQAFHTSSNTPPSFWTPPHSQYSQFNSHPTTNTGNHFSPDNNAFPFFAEPTSSLPTPGHTPEQSSAKSFTSEPTAMPRGDSPSTHSQSVPPGLESDDPTTISKLCVHYALHACFV